MSTALYVIVGLCLAGLVLVAAARTVLSYLRYRGTRAVPCPETKETVGLDVDAPYAAVTSLVGGPQLRVKDCTRWPERESCGQECLARIETSPEDCLVRGILARWYEGKSCSLCGKPFGTIHWAEHRPALMSPQGETIEWRDLRAEAIYEVMDTHGPVCWDCHIAETFRRKHPDLVIDRKRPAPPTQ